MHVHEPCCKKQLCIRTAHVPKYSSLSIVLSPSSHISTPTFMLSPQIAAQLVYPHFVVVVQFYGVACTAAAITTSRIVIIADFVGKESRDCYSFPRITIAINWIRNEDASLPQLSVCCELTHADISCTLAISLALSCSLFLLVALFLS